MYIVQPLDKFAAELDYTLPRQYRAIAGKRYYEIFPWFFLDEWQCRLAHNKIKELFNILAIPFAFNERNRLYAAYAVSVPTAQSTSIIEISTRSTSLKRSETYLDFVSWICHVLREICDE